MTHSTLCLNYRYELPGRRLLEIIKATAKQSLTMVGTTLEASAASVTFLADGSTMSFHLASANHLTVRTPARHENAARRICNRLRGQQIIEPIHEKTSRNGKTDRAFRPAREILTTHMAKPEWAEHILVLPEALAQAEECRFENDGPLDRYLTNLLKYAQARRDPANARKPNDYLAQQAGLTHYADGIGLAAQTKYPEDYTATYQGQTRIFGPHVTIGKGFDPRLCMSIHFDWDPVAQKLLLARFGRHGRGA